MTDRNALATSMSRRAGRGGPLDEGRRRGTQDGQAVPLGGHRETLWSWAQASGTRFLASTIWRFFLNVFSSNNMVRFSS